MSNDFVALLESGTLSTRICRGELVLGDGAAKTYDSRPALIAGGCRFHRFSKTWRRSATDVHRAAIAKARVGSEGEAEARPQRRRQERTDAEERDFERVFEQIAARVEAEIEWKKRVWAAKQREMCRWDWRP
jgi:hypothetical protein